MVSYLVKPEDNFNFLAGNRENTSYLVCDEMGLCYSYTHTDGLGKMDAMRRNCK
jgi:hypothetical protein